MIPLTRRIRTPQLFLLILTLHGVTRISGSASSANHNGLVKLPSLDDQRERIGFVQKSLCDRFVYVTKGQRISDFHQWTQEQGGEAKIFSMHGVDVNFEMDELQNMELEVNIVPLSKTLNPNDPFLPDRLNLNLAHTMDLKFNTKCPKEADERPPTTVQLSFRAAKLSLHFAPVLTTAWLAAVSQKFRRGVWYRWMASCLASSGAAFIKWGQWAATRNDMFPLALCDALSELHNAAPEHSWNFTQAQVECSLDIPAGSLLEVFESFDVEPLASGSIAQVGKNVWIGSVAFSAHFPHWKSFLFFLTLCLPPISGTSGSSSQWRGHCSKSTTSSGSSTDRYGFSAHDIGGNGI
jgi:hypothetical protein